MSLSCVGSTEAEGFWGFIVKNSRSRHGEAHAVVEALGGWLAASCRGRGSQAGGLGRLAAEASPLKGARLVLQPADALACLEYKNEVS